MIKLLALIVMTSMLAACSSPMLRSASEQGIDPRHHTIYVNPNGDIEQSDEFIEESLTIAEQSRESQYVENIIHNIAEVRKNKPDLKVVIFVHGGLNSLTDAWSRGATFPKEMLAENRYPIFIGWNSGGVPNYVDHLLRIRQGERYGVLAGWATSPFVLLTDAVRSVARTPAAISQSIYDLVTITKTIKGKAEKDFQPRMDRVADPNLNRFSYTSRPPFDGTGQYVTAVNPAKFVLAPFLDGLGSGAWDSMLRRTDLVLSKPLAFAGDIDREIPEDYSDTAVTKLLKRLEMQQREEVAANKKPVHIDLIGHSMGAFVINNILSKQPSLAIDNVVFMGAAAPVKDLENVVVPWLRRQPKEVKFYNLSIDPYREMSENFFWDFVPRGSLLHWIDNIFGEVNSFKDRTAGSWWNIIRAAEDVFPPDVRRQVHLTRFSIGGTKFGPQKHGEFDNYYFWRKEFWCAERELSVYKPGELPPPHIEQNSACTKN